MMKSTEELLMHAHRYADHLHNLIANNTNAFVQGATVMTVVLVFWLVKHFEKKENRHRGRSPDPEKPSQTRPTKPKAADRKPGEWLPVDFQRPEAPPLLDWDVHKSEPLPYRPFKYGNYHITMGLRQMNWHDWIELDNHYLKFHADKARRIEERGDQCCRTAPEAMDAAIEFLEELSVSQPYVIFQPLTNVLSS